VSVSLWGFIAYLALCASVITGTVLSSSFLRRRLAVPIRAGILHEILSLAGLAAATIHVFRGVLLPQGDRFLLLLFMSPGGRPSLAFTLGVAGWYGTLLATGTFYLRNRVSSPLWRWLHALAYPAFAAAAWHSVVIGANTWLPPIRVTYITTLALATALVCWRLLEAAVRLRAAS